MKDFFRLDMIEYANPECQAAILQLLVVAVVEWGVENLGVIIANIGFIIEI
jgi:hypothetical protein